ncbi:hypothetical protein HYH03_009574 [Edaphochlamys debaryana]|uniref:MYND-type domain-containing protein n=1 Tax=Edaphochlamys debaryana TaxID=47281 RepID=A0A835XXK9_9CHLO|nr:hypothetical protein HYH03_009574 [Edaphochlamys debaryana]|eukprot:KAG2492078.1 hypothetical protein HYH03_009574 [Edaphochlamys debaryana]
MASDTERTVAWRLFELMRAMHAVMSVDDASSSLARQATWQEAVEALDALALELRQQRRSPAASDAAACEAAWLGGLGASGASAWLLSLMQDLPARTRATADPRRSVEECAAQRNVCSLAYRCVCSLLGFNLEPLLQAQLADLTAWNEAYEQGRSVLSVDFAAALAETVRCAAQHAKALAEAAGTGASAASAEAAAGGSVNLAVNAANYVQHVLRMIRLHPELTVTSRADRSALPGPVSRLLDILTESNLLPAVAEAVMQCPAPAFAEGGDADGRLLPYIRALQGAISSLNSAIASTIWACRHVDLATHASAGAGAAEQGHALSRQLVHPAVTAFCIAQLGRLAAHGGIEPEGAGGAGRWWLTQLEVERGSVLGFDGLGAAAVLEDQHCQWLYVSQGLLRVLSVNLAARTAEALCRLYKGQGLAGSYSGARTWQFARTPVLTELLEPSSEVVTPGALPYWLEAGARRLALCLEAVAAELDGPERAGLPAGAILAHFVGTLGPAQSAQRALTALKLALGDGGLERLSIVGHRDALQRLHRADLASSLDYVVRLAFTATDRAARDRGVSELQRTAEQLSFTVWIMPSVLRRLPFSMLLPGAVEAPASSAGPAALDCGSAAGLLVTLAKRANTLGTRMKRQRAVHGTLPRLEDQLVLLQALSVLAALAEGTSQLCLQLAPVEASRAAPGSAAPSSVSSRSGAVEGARSDELLAFELRSASRLSAVTAAAAAEIDGRSNDPQFGCLGTDPKLLKALTKCTEALAVAAVRPDLVPLDLLMACQPHRLLAAACQLLSSHPDVPAFSGARGQLLAVSIVRAVMDLASNEQLSGRVRMWLRQPRGPAGAGLRAGGVETGGTGAGGAEDGGAEAGGAEAGGVEAQAGDRGEATAPQLRGCLERLLRVAIVPFHRELRVATGCTLALLHTARRAGGGDSGGATTAEQAFGAVVQSLRDWMTSDGRTAPPVLPGGVNLDALVNLEVGGRSGADEAAALVAAPLPPPMTVPPAALALRQLRVCGFPGCSSFGGRCEDGLPLKLCGRCRSVRYCEGGECQRAHWRGKHKQECGGMAAARESGRAG